MCCIILRDRVSGWSNKKRGKRKKEASGRTASGSADEEGEGGTRKKNKVRGEQEVARVKRKAPVARPRAKRAEWSSRPSGRNFPGAARASLFREAKRKRKREGEGGKGRRERGIFYFVRGSNCQPVFRGGKIKYKGCAPVHREVYANRTRRRCSSESDGGTWWDPRYPSDQ